LLPDQGSSACFPTHAASRLVNKQCDGYGSGFTLTTWTLRVSLPVYIMAIQSVFGALALAACSCQQPLRSRWWRVAGWLACGMVDAADPFVTLVPTPTTGWILFLVFAGWGMMAAPIDWIHQYMRRPRAVITKSEFINRARGLAQRAKEIKVR